MHDMADTDDEDILLREIFRDYPFLLQDLEHHSNPDIPGLLRRLDSFFKQYSRQHHQLTVPETQTLVLRLLQVSLCLDDSIKLTRAVEKVIRFHEATCKDLIFNFFQNYLLEKTSCLNPENKTLAKVSILFEQNSVVQKVLQQELGLVSVWVATLLESLVKIPPADLSPTQTQCLTALVKICLQMFQVCSTELGAQIWNIHPHKQKIKPPVNHIVERLVQILSTEGYTSECVLLCGTAVAIIINTNNDQNAAWLVTQTIIASALGVPGLQFSVEQLSQLKDQLAYRDKILQHLPQVPAYFLGPAAIIRALVALGKVPLLLTSISDHTVFNQLYNYILTLCKGDITLHYHSFNALQLWFSRLNKIISLEQSQALKQVLPSILESTLQLMVVNWESPVENVAEAVVSIFSELMSAWMLVKDMIPDLPQRVLVLVTGTLWYVKGRYRVLAVLLKYIDTDQVLQDCPFIQDQLMQCLTTNHLAATSTVVYKTFLQQIKGDAARKIECWRLKWMDTLCTGLISTNRLLCFNMSLHWLPLTTKVLPSCTICLQDNICVKMTESGSGVCRSRWLHAWITVTRSIRNFTGTVNLKDSRVRECLCCADEDVRAEALGLVCNTLKKSEAVTDVEAAVMKETVTFNIKLDSAPFRQTLRANLHRLLVRLRETSILMLKNVKKNKEQLDCSIEFVDWLHTYCVHCLLPGACYQRRKGALDLLKVIYDTLIYLPNSQQRKGFTPENTLRLVQFAQTRGQWMFQNQDTTHSLLLTLLDSSEEIQDSAFHLLTGFSSNSLFDTDGKLCTSLLQEALRLCHSPKGREGQSGAVICKLIFQKYVMDQKMSLRFTFCDADQTFSMSERGDGCIAAGTFLRALLTEVDRCLKESEANLVQASKQYPIHGLVTALYQCLTETPSLWSVVDMSVLTVVNDLITFCQSLINKMLGIMARSVSDQDRCPSFAEIGIALETLLQENQCDYMETTAQSPEYQYMMSWCWNNIKASCMCLGEMCWMLVTQKVTLATEIYSDMCNTFINVLTKCRHKGVIEGTRTAFIRFCSAMFNSSEEQQLLQMPRDTLQQVLGALKTSSLVSSVTRRSAGLPIIIQAVLISEKKVNKSSLLRQTVGDLFETCQLPLVEGAGLQDLPQVHAINILEQLYSDASLTASLMGHISKALLLVIDMFGSPSWAIRNAATRLFRTLMTRVFGQKKNNDSELGSSVTFQELTSHYPELPPFLLTVLKQAAERNIGEIGQLHPGLFPVLTLLSFLKPTSTQNESLQSIQLEFMDTIQLFTASPVYQLRHLVAPAFVAMVNMSDMMSAAQESFVRMSQCKANGLQGELLIVSQLVDYVNSLEDLQVFWQRLMEMCTSLVSCDMWMVTAQCVHVVHKVYRKHQDFKVPPQLLEHLTDTCCRKYSQGSIGGGVFSEKAVHFLFSFYLHTGEPVTSLLSHLLTSQNEESRRACLERLSTWLRDQLDVLPAEYESLLQILLQHVQDETSVPNLSCTFDLVTRLCIDKHVTKIPDNLDAVIDWFTHKKLVLEQHVSLGAKSLPVLGIFMKDIVNNFNILSSQKPKLSKWCDHLYDLSTHTNETQRMAAAQALLVAGQPILCHVTQTRDTDMEQGAIKLVSACLTLIQDEDTVIRSEACKFVTQLHWEDKPIEYASLHSNICYEVFLSYIGTNLYWSSACVHLLSTLLYAPLELTSILKVKDTTRFQQLFDQEDNSFFAERLYNSIAIQTTLKTICRSCLATDNIGSVHGLVQMSTDIHADLSDLLQQFRTVMQGTVIHKYCDNNILAVLTGLILLAECVAMVTKVDEDRILINKLIREILKINVLPASAQTLLAGLFSSRH